MTCPPLLQGCFTKDGEFTFDYEDYTIDMFVTTQNDLFVEYLTYLHREENCARQQ